MSKELIEQATEATVNLDELSRQEFGSEITAPQLIVPKVTDEGLRVITGHEMLPQASLVPLGANFAALTQKVNRGFGLLTVENGVRKLYPAVITPRTTTEKLCVTYLPEPVVLPTEAERAIDDDGEDKTVSDVQKRLLCSARGIQDRGVGTEHSHGNVAKSVTEIGHTAMVLRALTDGETMNGIKLGKHVVHGWTEEKKDDQGQQSSTKRKNREKPMGIAPKLTERDPSKPGAFDMQTTHGRVMPSLLSLELAPTTPGIVLVSHKAFELPETNDTKFIVGLGLVAAQQYHPSRTALIETMLGTMDRVH